MRFSGYEDIDADNERRERRATRIAFLFLGAVVVASLAAGWLL